MISVGPPVVLPPSGRGRRCRVLAAISPWSRARRHGHRRAWTRRRRRGLRRRWSRSGGVVRAWSAAPPRMWGRCCDRARAPASRRGGADRALPSSERPGEAGLVGPDGARHPLNSPHRDGARRRRAGRSRSAGGRTRPWSPRLAVRRDERAQVTARSRVRCREASGRTGATADEGRSASRPAVSHARD